jgi:hypothetical protein
MTNTRNKAGKMAEAERDAKELVDQIVQQEPRLKAARNARRQQLATSSFAQSLQQFRQRLKN